MSLARRLLPRRVRGYIRLAEGRLAAARVALPGASSRCDLPAAAFRPLLRRLTDFPSVLDVGTGTMATLATLGCRVRVGVEAHRPYLERRVADPTLVGLHLDASRLEDVFLPRSFAVVTLMDVIEHFELEQALALLERCERIAARRCVVFTPSGEFPQDEYDALGLGGEEYQRHRSVWLPDDFVDLGFSVAVLKRFHGPGNLSFDAAFPGGGEPIDAILAWKDVRARAQCPS